VGEVVGGGLLELSGGAEDVLLVEDAIGFGHGQVAPIMKKWFRFRPDTSILTVVRDFPPTNETPTRRMGTS